MAASGSRCPTCRSTSTRRARRPPRRIGARRGRRPPRGGATRAALGHLEQPLLPELGGRWVEERRAELEELRSDAFETLARAALALGAAELPAAERAARALIQREPYRESGYGVLMEALAARGNLAEALRVYDRLRVLLRDELGATPAPHITALNERLLMPASPRRLRPRRPWARSRSRRCSRGSSSARSSAASPSWRVLRALERPPAARAASSCSPARPASARRGWRRASPPRPTPPARPSCTGASTRRPSSPTSRSWRRCATTRPTRRDAARARPSARAARPGAGRRRRRDRPGERENRRYRLFEAVAALLGQAAATRPLLLVIEDLQWAGRPTLLLLRHVVRRLHGAPLLVLVTLRDAEADPGGAPARLLADLSREQVVRRVALSGLGEAETAALVGDADARPHASRTAPPATRSSSRRCCAASPRRPTSAPGLPEGVKALVSRRLSRLEPDDRRDAHGRRRARPRLPARHARGDGRAAGGGAARAARGGAARRRRDRGRGARRPLRLRACARARDALRRARRRRAARACTCGRARRSRPPARRPASSPTTSSPPARSAVPRRPSPTAPRRRARPWPRTPTRRPRGTSSRRSSLSGRHDAARAR